MLIEQIADRRMAVFGIGVGMQLLNVSQGGNLFLHIAEDLPTAIPHKDLQDPGHRHGLEVAPPSLMERVYGDGEIRVNGDDYAVCKNEIGGFLGECEGLRGGETERRRRGREENQARLHQSSDRKVNAGRPFLLKRFAQGRERDQA